MMIPSAVIQVNEAHPTLHQPASKKTIGSVATVTRFGSVELKCRRRFVQASINPGTLDCSEKPSRRRRF